jgi:hypothetical protein
MKRIYVASALENAKTCQDLAYRLSGGGHQIASTWHFVSNETDLRAQDNALTDDEREAIASIAHHNLMRANALVVLYDDRCRSTLYEVGVAYTSGHRIVIIGEKSKVPTMLAQRGIVFIKSSAEVEKNL